MVQLEEVEDEEFDRVQAGENEFEDDDFTDTESEISDDEAITTSADESLSERILALRDIVSPAARRRISSTMSTAGSWLKGGAWFGGKAMWVVTTTMLLWGIPFGIALVEEQQAMEAIKEQQMKDMGNEMLTSGGTSGGQGAKAAL